MQQLCPKCKTRPGVPMFNLVAPCDPCYRPPALPAADKSGRWLTEKVFRKTGDGPPPVGWQTVTWIFSTTTDQEAMQRYVTHGGGAHSRKNLERSPKHYTDRKNGDGWNLVTGEYWPVGRHDALYFL